MNRIWESYPMRFIRRLTRLYFDKRVSRSAAGLAYFLILSIFPVLICVSAFLGRLNLSPTSIVRVLEPILPESLVGIVREYIRYVSVIDSPAFFAVGVFMTVFFVSAAMRGVMTAVDDIYGKRGWPGFWQLLASVVFSFLLIIAMYLSIVVVLTGGRVFHLVEKYLPVELGPFWNWQWIRFLLLFGIMFLTVLALYRLAAPHRPKEPKEPVLLGALAATAALVGASALFSLFIGLSSNYSLVYGSLASVILLMIWLYLCGNIVVLGSGFNYIRYEMKMEKKNLKKGEENP